MRWKILWTAVCSGAACAYLSDWYTSAPTSLPTALAAVLAMVFMIENTWAEK